MLFARIEEVQDEYQAKGWLPSRLNLNKGVVRGIIEITAWGLYQLYQFLEETFAQAVPKQSGGGWLDLHADQVELKRKTATKARGVVHFTRSGTAGNVPIPKGRILRTAPDGQGRTFRYVTTEDAVLPDGQTEIAVPVESEDYGAAANATPGLITEAVTPVSGVDGAENRADWLTEEGADSEIDRQLAARYPLQWQGVGGVTKYAYESWALGVPGVVAAHVRDQHPRGQGTVDVVIKGAAGLPTAELLDKVRAAVAPNVPMNDDWLVKGPEGVEVSIDAELVLVPGSHEATALSTAEARLRALFRDPNEVDGVLPLQIGDDLTLDRLVGVLMAVSGVKRVVWTSPAADTPVQDDGLAVLKALTLRASTEVA